MTPEEVAAELQMDLRHVRSFIRRKALVVQEDGTITREDFEDFAERRDAARKDLAEAFERHRTGESEERAITEIVETMKGDR